jgi:hypothetical protein
MAGSFRFGRCLPGLQSMLSELLLGSSGQDPQFINLLLQTFGAAFV